MPPLAETHLKVKDCEPFVDGGTLCETGDIDTNGAGLAVMVTGPLS